MERITKIKPFIDKYNWEGINYPSKKCHLKKIVNNNPTIVLNVLHVKKEENMVIVYILKHNSYRKKQINLLMISIGEGWQSLAAT